MRHRTIATVSVVALLLSLMLWSFGTSASNSGRQAKANDSRAASRSNLQTPGEENELVDSPVLNLDPTLTPTLGNYPNTTLEVSQNTTVPPDAAPAGATSINVATTSNFKGTFVANPITGVVSVTDAHPAGNYTVMVKAFGADDSAATTFTLTVRTGTACTGDSNFTNGPDIGVGTNPGSVAIGDFNNDGKQDLAVTNVSSNSVSIRLGDGLGGFSGPTEVSVGPNPTSVAIGDFNNDGRQDLATGNLGSSRVSIRLGDGLGGFSGTTEVPVSSPPFSVAIGDFNNDGKKDLAVANFDLDAVSIRFGDGLGGFSGTTRVPAGGFPVSVVIGDFNNDGKQDLAAADFFQNKISIRLGDGLGGFSGTTDVSVGANPHSVAIGDFNNDGKQDLAVANGSSNSVSIRLGDGLGGFSGTTEVSVGASPASVSIGDFNNDGKQDLAVANSSGISIRLGDGLGGFNGTTEVPVGSVARSIAIGDFNNDGRQDLAVPIESNSVLIRLGSCDACSGNVALAANGATAFASSEYNNQFPVGSVIDGEHDGNNWESGGGWNDATPTVFPDIVQVNFNASRTINEIDVYTLKDDFNSGSIVDDATSFTLYGITNFNVQYWTGTTWADVPDGAVSENNLVKRKFIFSSITTDRIRVVVNDSADHYYSRVVEIEAFLCFLGGPSPTPTPTPLPTPVCGRGDNLALPANGGSAIASSEYNNQYPVGSVIDGERDGNNWGSGGGWNDATPAVFPDIVQVNFGSAKMLSEIDVYTLKDDFNSGSTVNDASTFSLYGITNFNVQYWTGTAWADVPGGAVTGNNLVKRKFVFPIFQGVFTDRIRVVVNDSADHYYSRVVEIEAYECVPIIPI
jgi:sirohydrochlorin ferrochelatase